MSRFFKNLKEEASEVKAKTEAISDEAKIALSKNERKMKELSEKVEDVKRSRCFEKSAKKIMGELRKYAPLLKSTGVPAFLRQLFEEPRFISNKYLNNEAKEFLSQFDSKGESQATSIRQKTERKKEADLISILGIASDTERKDSLKQLNLGTLSSADAFSVTISLFMIAKKQKDPLEMIKVLKEYLSRDEVEERFFSNMNLYLETIDANLPEECYSEYSSLLSELIMRGWRDGEVKRTEFQFLKLGEARETTIEPFNVLYLLRTGRWHEAKDIIGREGNRMNEENTQVTFEGKRILSRAWCSTLQEYGRVSAQEKAFEEAFGALETCWSYGVQAKPLTYALCVVLIHSVSGSAVFAEFLEEFKGFDENSLLLESHEAVDEIFRAFYLLHKKDWKTAGHILEKQAGIDAYRNLKEFKEGLK